MTAGSQRGLRRVFIDQAGIACTGEGEEVGEKNVGRKREEAWVRGGRLSNVCWCFFAATALRPSDVTVCQSVCLSVCLSVSLSVCLVGRPRSCDARVS